MAQHLADRTLTALARLAPTAVAIVLAKAPIAGRAKTRLCPPCTPEQAAAVAQAALDDTIAAVDNWACESSTRVRLLSLDSGGTDYAVRGWPTVAQCEGDLAARLSHVFSSLYQHLPLSTPTFLVAMDTPQLSSGDLDAAFTMLQSSDVVFGPATDGGYWGVGMTRWTPGLFDNVAMSTSSTLAQQLTQARSLTPSVGLLHELSDMDTFEDVCALAREFPALRIASVLADEQLDASV